MTSGTTRPGALYLARDLPGQMGDAKGPWPSSVLMPEVCRAPAQRRLLLAKESTPGRTHTTSPPWTYDAIRPHIGLAPSGLMPSTRRPAAIELRQLGCPGGP